MVVSMWKIVVSVIFVLTVGLDMSQGARILLLGPNAMMNSHLLELLAIGDELVTRGHDVYTPLCANGWPMPENSTKRLPKSAVKELEYPIDDQVLKDVQQKLDESESHANIVKMLETAQEVIALNVQLILENTEFMDNLKQMNFDLAIADGFFLAPYHILVAHVLRITYVTSTAQINLYVGGSPLIPSIHSNMILNDAVQHSFTYRLLNTLSQVAFNFLTRFINSGQYLLTKYAPGVSSWQELVDQSLLFFITRDHVLDNPQPYFPNVIATPALTYSPAKPLLAGELEAAYSKAKSGVILVSFGSTHKPSIEAINKMIAAFGKVEQTIVMRLEKDIEDSLQKVPVNVKIFSWLPQNDCLGHERTKLFITHGGNNGVYESLYHGVPMVGFPLTADQPFQVKLIEARGYGLGLNVGSFTSDDLVKVIKEILANPMYSANVKKASAILKDRPLTPRQTVVYWIEHVIKHGHQHLRSHAMDLAWYEYFMVDVLVCVSGIVGVLLVVMWYIVRCCCCCCRCCCGKCKTSKVKAE